MSDLRARVEPVEASPWTATLNDGRLVVGIREVSHPMSAQQWLLMVAIGTVLLIFSWHYFCVRTVTSIFTARLNSFLQENMPLYVATMKVNPVTNLVQIELERQRPAEGIGGFLEGATMSVVISAAEPELNEQLRVHAKAAIDVYALMIEYESTFRVIEAPARRSREAVKAEVNQQRVEAVEGQYSGVVVENDAIFSSFPDVLRRDKAIFAERLEVQIPVTLEANFWFGSGCKAHSCGREEAAWAIDRDIAKGYAVILTSGVAGPAFSIYGGEPDELPAPLLSWALGNGLNDSNWAASRPRTASD